MAHVLLVTDDTGHNAATRSRDAITSQGHTVTLIAESSAASASLVGVDVIGTVRVSQHALAPWLSARWSEGFPLLVGAYNAGVLDGATGGLAEDLGIWADSLVNDYVQAGSQSRSLIDIAEHEVAAGFAPGSDVQIVSGNNFTGRDRGSSAGIIIGSIAANSNAPAGTYMSAVSPGDLLQLGASAPGSAAPARAVACGWLYAGQSDYTADGRLILGQAVTWLATPPPSGLIVNPVADFALAAQPPPSQSPSTPVDGTAWSLNSVASSGSGIVTLIDNTNSDSASVITTETFDLSSGALFSGVFEAQLQIGGSADEMQFGILDAAQPATSLASDGLLGVAGFWGWNLDIYNDRVRPVVNGGAAGSTVSHNPGTGSTYATWRVTFRDDGATMTSSLYRDGALISSQAGLTKPAFAEVRVAIGARTGASRGTFRAQGTPILPASVSGEPEVSLSGTIASPVAAFTLDAPPIPPEVALAGAVGDPVAAFGLHIEAPATVALAGSVGSPVAAFSLSAAATASLAGIIVDPEASFAVDVTGSAAAQVSLTGVVGDPAAAFSIVVPVQPQRNRVGGRARSGHWGATFSPEVVAPPTSAVVHNKVRAIAYDVPAFDVDTMPTLIESEHIAEGHRERVVIGGKDITYFRGTQTPPVAYQLIEPLLWGTATLELPQVAACFEKPGAGALSWLTSGANVLVQRVDTTTGKVVATDYRGIIVAFNARGNSLSVECGGHASGRGAMRDKPVPIVTRSVEMGKQAWNDLSVLGLRLSPRLGPKTGMKTLNWGGASQLDHINELCAKAVTRGGKQWTIMPNQAGVYSMSVKDTTTIHGTVYCDDSRTVADLRRDIAEEPNRIFATGITPEGLRVKFAAYPGLRKSRPAPYPFSDGRSFGEGTTNAQTDTGDGVSAMVWRLRTTGYLAIEDAQGGYDADVVAAIEDLQDDADLSITGRMNKRTWSALYDLSATGWSLRRSLILPAAQRSVTRKWRRTASGSVISRNPNYDRKVLPVDHSISVGNGFTRAQIKAWARSQLFTGENWAGTITFNTGAIPAGDHTPGTPVSSILRDRDIKPGMNLRLPLFAGGITVHVSGITVQDGRVTAVVDTKARDTLQAWEAIQRNRESRNNPARLFMAQHRSSATTKDQIVTFDEVGGRIDDRIKLDGGKWNVFPVVAAQAGTIAKLRLDLGPGVEFVTAVFGKRIGRKRLNAAAPAPLTKEGKQRWANEGVRRRLDRDHVLLYVAGDIESPCGYFPGEKSESGGVLTGRWEDDGGFGYATFRWPVLWVAIWPTSNCSVKPGRIMWPQLEEGS